MKTAEWELIDSLPKRYKNLISSDLINEKISSYSISRGENLEIISEFIYEDLGRSFHSRFNAERHNHPAGTVRIDDSKIELSNIYDPDEKINLSGVISNGYTIKTKKDGVNEVKETFQVRTIKSSHDNPRKTEFIIEWLANLNISQYTWPHMTKTEVKTKTTKTFSSYKHSMTLSDDNEQHGTTVKCCHINIDGFDIYFGNTDEGKLKKHQHPGYIIYEGNPDSDLRMKIRLALSFITGSNILYLGCSELDKEMYIVGFEAHTPNSMGGLFFKTSYSPPSRLMSNDSRYYIADSQIVSKMVSNFVESYEKYDLSHISWLYWHAMIAPVHLKAVCFGAVLEFIQKTFLDKNENLFKSSLIDKKDWKTIAKDLRETIDKSEIIDDNSKKVLLNKISNLNSTPQSILTERFFTELGLKLSEKERKSYARRNDAAHGNKTPDDNFIDLIRDSKLLHILCNRVLISILALADNYTDFYTLGHAFRELSEPVSE